MIIDFHTNIFPPDLIETIKPLMKKDRIVAELFKCPNIHIQTVDQLLISMNKNGISKSVVLGMGWTDPDVNRHVNDYILNAGKNYPSRIIPFTGINPAAGRIGYKEAERCIASGAAGFGEVHSSQQSFNISDKKAISPFMKLLYKENKPVVVHASEPVGHLYPGKGNATPEKLVGFVTNFPDSKIVLAHWGGGLPFYELMPEISDSFNQVYYDTAASPFLYKSAIFEASISLVGRNKILFGSDSPLINPDRILEQIKRSKLAIAEQKSILSGNALSLLGPLSEQSIKRNDTQI